MPPKRIVYDNKRFKSLDDLSDFIPEETTRLFSDLSIHFGIKQKYLSSELTYNSNTLNLRSMVEGRKEKG